MRKTPKYLLAVTALLLSGSPLLLAQDPFGGGDPFGSGGTTTAEPGTAGTSEPEDVETDLVVLSLRDSKPTTAEELVRAVEILIDLGRPDEASTYLQTLLDANPNPAALSNLQRKFGSALFLRILRHAELQPAGAQVGNAVLDAAYQHTHSPPRLQSLIAQLKDASPEQRHTTVVDLRAAGQSAVAALIGVLAEPGRAAEHARIREALVRLGTISVEPLMAVLQADDSPLRIQVLVTLGQLEAPAATPYLLGPFLSPGSEDRLKRAARYALMKVVGQLPTEYDARFYLLRQAKSHLAASVTLQDSEDLVPVWYWDPDKRTVDVSQVTAGEAALNTAFRIAGELQAIAPDNLEYRRLYLTALLASAKKAIGLDQPLATGNPAAHSLAAAAGAEAIEEVLSTAMRQEQIAAAIGAAEVLGDIGDDRLLIRASGRPRPLAQALQHADRRLRYTAAMSILAIDPQDPFPGSSYLPETLSYFLNTLGTRRALITHPRIDQAQTLVALLSQLGFAADTAPSGAVAIRLAARSSDYEFILVSDAIDQPDVNELIQQMRRDPRTAVLPIGLMARDSNFKHLERLTESDPLAETFPRPHDLVGVALVARRLLKRGERQRVDFGQRIHQASSALDQMARLAEQPWKYDFYDLFRQESALENTLLDSSLTPRAARVLGLLGTPAAQRALITVASQDARSLADRQSAAAAFAVAVQRRGLLLSRGEILLQYDRYNQSAVQDRQTQQVLGALLDAIEAPTRSGGSTDTEDSVGGAANVEQ